MRRHSILCTNRLPSPTASSTRILGLGIDLLHLPRLESVVKKYPQRLPCRILSPQESLALNALLQEPKETIHPQRILEYLGTRFSVKESAYKALSLHFPHLSWKDLTLSHSPRGTFTCQLESIYSLNSNSWTLLRTTSPGLFYFFLSRVTRAPQKEEQKSQVASLCLPWWILHSDSSPRFTRHSPVVVLVPSIGRHNFHHTYFKYIWHLSSFNFPHHKPTTHALPAQYGPSVFSYPQQQQQCTTTTTVHVTDWE
jgi:phosphopantetheine--protein transferase-like protein